MTTDTPTGFGPGDDASHSGPLRRARAAALAELRRQPRATSWRRDAIGTLLAVVGTTALVVGIGAWTSIVEIGHFGDRLLPLILLIALQGLGVFAAIAPGRAGLRLGVALLAVAAAVAVVAGRGGPAAASSTPPLACSTSHVAVDLIPLGLVLFSLRKFSWTLGRSLLAGVAAAATGAIAGELSCGRGWGHALVHHVGAGVVIAVVCALLSRVRRPETFSP